MELDELRRELEAIDQQILEAVAQRQRVARRIEEAKAAVGRPIRDYQRERILLDQTEGQARALGLEPALARALMEQLIQSSIAIQEKQRIESMAGGGGRRALVIGGAGRMGRWFVRFLASQGFEVEVADRSAAEPPPLYEDWHDASLDHDVLVLATPLRVTATILDDLVAMKPTGVVLDLGSLKSPLGRSLRELAAAGVDVASLHPLFGPDTDLLSGHHVALIDLGCERATTLARELFASTMAMVVPMELEEHDRLMAWVLGLSHALNLAFVESLQGADAPLEVLTALASTTFDRQLAIAHRVAQENPRLYFEIQNLNPHADVALEALVAAVTRLKEGVAAGDEVGFVEQMERGRRYLDAHGRRP